MKVHIITGLIIYRVVVFFKVPQVLYILTTLISQICHLFDSVSFPGDTLKCGQDNLDYNNNAFSPISYSIFKVNLFHCWLLKEYTSHCIHFSSPEHQKLRFI